jgi:hypothetical protein
MRPLGFGQENPEVPTPCEEPVGVQLTALLGIDGVDVQARSFEPTRGERFGDREQACIGQLRLQKQSGARELRGPREEHVVADFGERVVGAEPIHRPLTGLQTMVKIQRSAVVDEPGLAVPEQEIRISWRPIDARHERIQQHDARGLEGIDHVPGAARHPWIERDAARQVVEAEVQPGAPIERRENLGIGLGRGECAIEIDQHELGHGESQRSPDFSSDELRDQRLFALACAAQFDNVKTEIVRFEERGDRAALTKRHHVPLGADGAEERARHAREGSRTSRPGQRPSFS